MAKQKTDPLREDALLAELTALRTELCEAHADRCSAADARSSLCLFRVFPGLTLPAWRKLADRHHLAPWLPLPFKADDYPVLEHYLETLERLAHQTDHDPLTGLLNQKAFRQLLDIEMERARRDRQAVSLVMLDLDDFKAVNDTFGHAAGDEALRGLAAALLEFKRRYDVAGRLGGEEFGLIITGVSQVKAASVTARILENFRRKTLRAPDGRDFSVSFSAGVACFKGMVPLTMETFMDLADKALYQAKRAGKSRVECAPLPDIEKVPTETLVLADEKRFLFGKKG